MASPWSPPPVAAQVPAAYEMRPLSLSELLDRIFSVYRSRFWLFAGIASIASLLQLILGVVHLAIVHHMRSQLTLTGQQVLNGIVGAGFWIFTFLFFAVTQAAAVFALGEITLGRDTSIGTAVRTVAPRWLRYVGIAIWQTWSAGWVAGVLLIPGYALLFRGAKAGEATSIAVGTLLVFTGFLVGAVVGVILYLRNALAVPASVMEELPVRASMRRSKQLAAGAKGRLFVVILIAIALYFVVGALQIPLGVLVFQAVTRHQDAVWAPAGLLVIQFFGSCVVTPVALIGFALIYFDQRVRKEAFDLQLLLGETEGISASAGEAWTPPSQSRFLTPDSAQEAASPAVYAPLVARSSAAEHPQEPHQAEAATPDAGASNAAGIEPASTGTSGDADAQ